VTRVTDRTPLFLLLGMGASVLLAIGLAMMKSRGATLPAARGPGLFGAIGRWLNDPVWLGGLALQTGGYVIYLVALSGAPVSMLAVTMQGGIALFVVVAVWFLGERANRREWIGIAGIVGAIFLLGLSLPGGATASVTNPPRLVLFSVAAVLAATITFVAERHHPAGVASAIASGLAFGMGSLYAKALVDVLATVPFNALAVTLIATPWTYLAVAANLTGLVLLQNSFHAARGIIVMPLSSACSNIVPILGGIIAFGERLPAAGGPAALRLAAFGLTLLSGGLLATSRE
jgi:drug/metabolite transporter (DMT)-like permease